MKTRKKFKSMLIAVVLLLTMLPTSAMAKTSNDEADATNALETFLSAVKDENLDKVVSLENDSRTLKSDLKLWHQTNFQNTDEQLSSFLILNKEKVSPTEFKILTKLSFKNLSIGFKTISWTQKVEQIMQIF